MQTTDVKKLIINRLTKEQYEAAKEAGTINENELYMTPADGEDVPVAWGNISGNIEDQIDLAAVLAEKQDALTADFGIIITADHKIKVNNEVIADVDYVDANITDTMNFIIQERNTERAARIAGDNLIQGDIDAIEAKIPAQASSTNQLTDKDFVNSSIATNTGHYIYKAVGGEKVPFDSLAELEAYTGTVTNNDYAFVTGTDEQGNTYYDRYKATVSEALDYAWVPKSTVDEPDESYCMEHGITAITADSSLVKLLLGNITAFTMKCAYIKEGSSQYNIMLAMNTDDQNELLYMCGVTPPEEVQIMPMPVSTFLTDSYGTIRYGLLPSAATASWLNPDIPTYDTIEEALTAINDGNWNGGTVTSSTITWAKEYRLNNSSFTAVQWAAINSGITAALAGKISTAIQGVQINGIDLVPDGNKKVNIPPAGNDLGVVKTTLNGSGGLSINGNGSMYIVPSSNAEIEAKTQAAKPVVPANLDKAIMEGLGNNSLTWDDTYKAAARETIGAAAASDIPSLTPRTETWEKLDGTTEAVTYYVAQGGIPSAAGEEF